MGGKSKKVRTPKRLRYICAECGKTKKLHPNQGRPDCCGHQMADKRDVRQRTVFLKRMGFSSYFEYLKSPLWQEIRSRVLARDPNCSICNRPAQCVHHRSYDLCVLEGKRDSSLESMCNACHRRIEFVQDGRKRGINGANTALNRMKDGKSERKLPHDKTRIWFGVHFGKAWSQAPGAWLEWIHQNFKNKEIAELAWDEIKRRAALKAAKKENLPTPTSPATTN